MIQLRDITDQNYSITKAIEYSVVSTFRNSNYGRENVDTLLESSVQKWIGSIRNKLLLLVDGLDELSDSMRFSFLSALDDYLLSNSQTHVIMTSRVGGFYLIFGRNLPIQSASDIVEYRRRMMNKANIQCDL